MAGQMSALGAALGGPIGWGMLGADVLGGLFGGMSQGNQFAQEMEERRRDRQQRQMEFERTQGQSEGNDAVKLARSLDSAPMRDRASFLMAQRLGQTPGNFAPGDMFNRGSYGRVDRDALAKANAGYQPGMGGTGGGEAVIKAFLNKLGYGGGSPAAAAPQADPDEAVKRFMDRRGWRHN